MKGRNVRQAGYLGPASDVSVCVVFSGCFLPVISRSDMLYGAGMGGARPPAVCGRQTAAKHGPAVRSTTDETPARHAPDNRPAAITQMKPIPLIATVLLDSESGPVVSMRRVAITAMLVLLDSGPAILTSL